MNITTIPWVKNPDETQGYTLNPFSGCRNCTPEGLCLGGLFPCYAWRLVHGRLKPLCLMNENIPEIEGEIYRDWKERYDDPFYPRFWEERLDEMTKRNDRLHYDGKKAEYPIKQRGIFICDMADLFGKGVPVAWTEKVLDEIWGNKGYDRFYLLTKQADRLPEFSPFPDNAWVGVTVTKSTSDCLYTAENYLEPIKAKVKYISFEPLLQWDTPARHVIYRGGTDGTVAYNPTGWLNWIIIGACTGSKKEMEELCKRYPKLTLMRWGKKWTAQPPIKWIQEIVEAADKGGIKVFLKDNLKPLLHAHISGQENTWALSKVNLYKGELFRQEVPNG